MPHVPPHTSAARAYLSPTPWVPGYCPSHWAPSSLPMTFPWGGVSLNGLKSALNASPTLGSVPQSF